MRALAILAVAILSYGGHRLPVGPTAAPSLTTPEYQVTGRIAGQPIVDHFVTLEVEVSAAEGHHLDPGYRHAFDVGGGCCFEKLHFDDPKLTPCDGDEKSSCRASFEVPFRVSGGGIAGGTLSFGLCEGPRCGLRKVSVAVPYDASQI